MAAPPGRLEQSRQSAGDAAAQADWLALVQQLLDAGAVQALQRELAIQSQCVAQQQIGAPLRVEQSALRADSVRESCKLPWQRRGKPACCGWNWAKCKIAGPNASKRCTKRPAGRGRSQLPLVQHLLRRLGRQNPAWQRASRPKIAIF